MSTVPYIFAGNTGNIPLSELDANFANVKALVDSANIVTNGSQPAITSVGTLSSLSVSGNIYSNGNIAMVSNVARNVYIANTAPGNTAGNIGDIWYQTF